MADVDVSAVDMVQPDHRVVTRDELELVLRGLLIPSAEMVHRMAWQLWVIRRRFERREAGAQGPGLRP